MLTAVQRRRRGAATALVLVVLVTGTFWGQDDHFPFGPFRMYSVRNRLDGKIRGARVEIVTADGRRAELSISPGTFGMRRAEVEGQVDRFRADPGLVGSLAVAFERFNPDEAPVRELRLFYQVTRLRGGRAQGPVTEETIATWSRS